MGGKKSAQDVEEKSGAYIDGVGAETKGIDALFAAVGGWFKQAESKEHGRATEDNARPGSTSEMELLVFNLPIGLTA